MHTNRVKQALKAGQMQLGAGFWQLRSAEIPRLLAGAGFDWFFLDTEHGGFDLETVQDLCRVANLSGIAPIVRVGDMEYSLVARALDCGAQGIIFPRVESPELLAQAVSWTKFPPQGVRGYGLSTVQLGYGKVTFPEAIEHTNANTLVVLQIETVRAFEARNELLSIPGIDAVLIGPSDLSISLGLPGDYENVRVMKTMEAIRDSCLEHNIAPGTHTRSVALAKYWKERGMLFLSCGNELAYLFERASDVAKQLKAS